MSVDVALGEALIEITNANLTPSETYLVYFHNDATVNVTVPTADATNPRIDIICLRVDVSTDPDASADNVAIIELVQGTPAGSPSAPSTPSNAIKLAEVSVPASDTTISSGQITDSRTYVTMDSSVLADVAREADVIKKGRAAFTDFSELTVSSGAITATQVLHTVDTESDAASDDLDTITAQVGDGEIIVLFAENASRVVTLKHGTGNITMVDSSDFALDSAAKSITLIHKDSTWYELARGVGNTGSGVTTLGTVTAASSSVGASDTNENVMAPTWTGSNSIPANSLAVGDTIRVRISGLYRLDSGVLRFRMKIGGSDMGEFADNSVTNAIHAYDLDLYFNVRSIGASGSIWPMGHAHFGNPDETDYSHDLAAGTHIGAITVDTTSALAITVAALFTASDSDHSANVQGGLISKEPSPA